MHRLAPHQALYVSAGILALHTVLLCLWYASTPNGSTRAAGDWSVVVRSYWMLPASALYGFIVGRFVHRAYLAWTTALSGVLAVCGAFMHWISGQVGLAVDWVTPAGAMTGAIVTFVIYTPISLLGSVGGRKLVAGMDR